MERRMRLGRTWFMNKSVKIFVDMWSAIWRKPSFTQRPRDTRLRALFIENLSGPVLQMLGTKYPYSILLSSSTYQRITFRYNIEPFFWSSSLNWIPSRFQEEIKENVGDRESDLKYSLFFFLTCLFRYYNYLDVLTLNVKPWCNPTCS